MYERSLTQNHRPIQTSATNWQDLQQILLAEPDSLLETTRQRLLRLAYLRAMPPDAVEDIVQETLLEAWKHLERLQTPTGFHLWVDEICRNICRRYARRQQSEQRLLPLSDPYGYEDDDTSKIEIADPHELDLADEVSRQDLETLLGRAMSYLAPSTRALVELCYLQEVPQREAARRLGLTLSALEARLHRARQQLRQVLSGPLRVEAEDFGLALNQDILDGWQETRIWCTHCGHRLQGMFLLQANGTMNIHMRCPDCTRRYGIDTVHSMGLVQLDGLRSWRPAWKRIMQELTQMVTQGLAHNWNGCLFCGEPAVIQIRESEEKALQGRSPFSIEWRCARCREKPGCDGDLPTPDEIVYWSHPRGRQFIIQHPRRINRPAAAIEYAGQPAIRFCTIDSTSQASLTVVAHRHTLRILLLEIS